MSFGINICHNFGGRSTLQKDVIRLIVKSNPAPVNEGIAQVIKDLHFVKTLCQVDFQVSQTQRCLYCFCRLFNLY
jgi:hypothetical protein